MTATDTPTDAATDRAEILEAKIDLLTEQVAILTAEAERSARQREAYEDLRRDLTRVSEGALDVVSRELDALGDAADPADLVRLLKRLVEVAPRLERALNGLDQASELLDDVVPLGPDILMSAAQRMEALDARGYFTMARAGAGVVDRVVANFSEDDVVQLGENVVTILETLKEITQPEMLAMLGNVVDAVKRQQHVVEHESDEAPSLWALAKQVREPDVRRGIARALGTLQAVSVETGPHAGAPESKTHPEGES